MNKNKKKLGFTLTELIIVIVIIGILAAVLIPSLTGYIKKAKVSKGTQNARNITTLLTGEVIFNDKEFLLPSEVIRVAKEGGYDLKSEVDGYAYWYDSETNTVVFKEMKEVVLAAGGTSRSLIEALSPSQPNLYYIDQTDNALKTTIETINNLVEIALSENGITFVAPNTVAKSNVLNTMESKVEELAGLVSNMKLDATMKTSIVDYIRSFNPTDTIYYSTKGWFNKQLESNYGTSNEIFVERAVVLNTKDESGKVILPEDGSGYQSVRATIEAPLIVPDTVDKLPDLLLQSLAAATILASGNTNINAAYIKGDVVLGTIASVDRVNYIQFTIPPKYLNKEYRFQNGHTFTIPSASELVLDENGALIVKTVTVTEEGETVTYAYYEVVNGQALTYHANYVTAQSTEDMIAKSVVEGELEKYLLSIAKIPTIEINNEVMKKALNISADKEFNFFDKFITSSGTIVGKISIRSTIEPFSVRYTGIMVDEDLMGYKIENIGYITDAILNSVQQTVDADGKITKDGNNTAKISVAIPDSAKSFVNFKNISVSVEYVAQSVEYTDFQPFGTPEENILRIPTGKIYESSVVHSANLTGSFSEGFELNLNDLSVYDTDFDGETRDCNQVRITKITITAEDGNVLFVRYYK